MSKPIHTNKSIFHPVHTQLSIGFFSKNEVHILSCRINMVAINDMTNKHSPAHFQVNIPSTQRNRSQEKYVSLFVFIFNSKSKKC